MNLSDFTFASLATTATWHAHRALVDHVGYVRRFSEGTHRVLLITERDRICRSQVFPFFFYEKELREQHGIELREISLEAFRSGAHAPTDSIDTVCLQTWFDVPHAALRALVAGIRDRYPQARIVYLDWFAPTDLRHAAALHDCVDVYVKKHVLRDRSEYGRPTRGDTTLVDRYSRAYGIEQPEVRHPIPSAFFDKLVIGPSFATGDYLLPRFLEPPHFAGSRSIDLHARLATEGTPWYAAMRTHAVSALGSMADLSIPTAIGVPRDRYMKELRDSKLTFSPFGYGEICWRDYEAVMSGSVLIKPDTSHVETRPDIFVAGETYIPIRWDFADLEEKVRYYLAHETERRAIAEGAFAVLADYFRSQRFVSEMGSVVMNGSTRFQPTFVGGNAFA